MFTGKSTLLAAIGNREFPIPKHVDIFLLKREMPPSDKTAIQCVMEVEEERIKLEKEAEILATVANDGRILLITVRNEVAKVMFLHVSVILSTGRWGCYPSMRCRWYPSMPCSRGGCSRGMPAPEGGVCSGGVETPPKADGYCCRRYASYWNAFL